MKKLLLVVTGSFFLTISSLKAQSIPEPLPPATSAAGAAARGTTGTTQFQITQQLTQTYVGTAWVNNSRTLLQKFAGLNLPQLSTTDSWNGATWAPMLYRHLRYTVDGQMKSDTFFTYLPGVPKAFPYTAIVQNFNSAKQLTERLTSAHSYGDVTWQPISRNQFSYTNGLGTQDLSQRYNSTTKKYENDSRILYTYNSAKQETQAERQVFANNAWAKDNLYQNTYTATNKLSQQLISKVVSNVYQVTYRWSFTYDAADRITKALVEEKKSTAWVALQQVLYTYDAKGNPSMATTQTWSGTAFVNASRVLYTGQLVLANSAARNLQFAATVAPNPAREGASLHYVLPASAQVSARVLDLSGRQIHLLVSGQTQQQGNHQLAIPAGLPAGLYLVQLSIDGETVQSKLMVE